MKKVAVVLSILAVIAVGVVVYLAVQGGDGSVSDVSSFQECVEEGHSVMESYPRKCQTPDGQTFTENIGNELEMQDVIRINVPRPNGSVESPLGIRGEARGSWYFEASFPVTLLDAEGNVVAEHFVEAQDEWMTEEFVPFRGTLEFEDPGSESGMLILKKANPSGLPENEAQLEVPVMFSQDSP